MIWRKRIPPTGHEKLNLEESQNKSEFDFYDLYRSTFEVKARTKLTEILYIFFGIHTANVVQLADRIEQRAHLAAA